MGRKRLLPNITIKIALLLRDNPRLVGTEIAELLGIDRRTAHKFLKQLLDNGVLAGGFIDYKKLGLTECIWIITPTGEVNMHKLIAHLKNLDSTEVIIDKFF